MNFVSDFSARCQANRLNLPHAFAGSSLRTERCNHPQRRLSFSLHQITAAKLNSKISTCILCFDRIFDDIYVLTVMYFCSALILVPDESSSPFPQSLSTFAFRTQAPLSGLLALSVSAYGGAATIILIACIFFL